MQKNDIKVGVITANYNSGDLYKDCLAGILNQTRKVDNIVVVDDASTDGSWINICNEISKKTKNVLNPEKSQHAFRDNGIEYLILRLAENKGPSYARNVGLQYLVPRTRVIAIADADDVYYPEKIEKSLDVLQKNKNVALVYSDYDTENMQTGEVKREYKEIFSFQRLFEECIVSNNSVFLSKIIEIVGGYDDLLRGAEDYDLWLRIAEKAAVHHIPEALYRYRLTGNNTTVTTPPDKFGRYVNYVHQKALQRREEHLVS